MGTTGPNWPAILLICFWLAMQYGFAIWALRDLLSRPRLRSDRRLLWLLLILIVPIAGPVLYSTFGSSTSRPQRRQYTRVRRPPRKRSSTGA
jgi:hypothetical protein